MLDKMCVFSFFRRPKQDLHLSNAALKDASVQKRSMMSFACAFSENTTGRSSATLIAGTLGVSLARKC